VIVLAERACLPQVPAQQRHLTQGLDYAGFVTQRLQLCLLFYDVRRERGEPWLNLRAPVVLVVLQPSREGERFAGWHERLFDAWPLLR
jgi:hypothetical protein